jgi:hypothetical protein
VTGEEKYDAEALGLGREERFLSAQADPLQEQIGRESVGLLRPEQVGVRQG